MKVDATDHVMGRMATSLVEKLKDGEDIEVYNAGEAIIKGNPEQITNRYKNKYSSGKRDHGSYTPRNPAELLRKSVKGMLPDNSTGRDMLGRLKVYKRGPVDSDESDLESFEGAREESLKGSNFITVGELADNLRG